MKLSFPKFVKTVKIFRGNGEYFPGAAIYQNAVTPSHRSYLKRWRLIRPQINSNRLTRIRQIKMPVMRVAAKLSRITIREDEIRLLQSGVKRRPTIVRKDPRSPSGRRCVGHYYLKIWCTFGNQTTLSNTQNGDTQCIRSDEKATFIIDSLRKKSPSFVESMATLGIESPCSSTWKLFRHWLDERISDHPECRAQTASQTEKIFLARLLHIQDADPVRLIHPPTSVLPQAKCLDKQPSHTAGQYPHPSTQQFNPRKTHKRRNISHISTKGREGSAFQCLERVYWPSPTKSISYSFVKLCSSPADAPGKISSVPEGRAAGTKTPAKLLIFA